MVNSGSIESDQVSNKGTLENHGNIEADVANDGTLNNGEDGSIQSGTVTNGEEGQITNNGSIKSDTVVNDGSLTNTETGTLAGHKITNNNEMVNSGKVESDQVSNKGTLENHGNIEADVANDGTLTGEGDIAGSATEKTPVKPDDEKDQGKDQDQNTNKDENKEIDEQEKGTSDDQQKNNDMSSGNTGASAAGGSAGGNSFSQNNGGIGTTDGNRETDEQEKGTEESQPQNNDMSSGETGTTAADDNAGENRLGQNDEGLGTQANADGQLNVRTVRAQMKDGRIILPEGALEQDEETGQGGGQAFAVGTEGLADTDEVTIALGTGNITVQVVHDGYSYAAGIVDAISMVNAALTGEQIQRVYDGEDMQIEVSMTEISDRVSEKDKEVIENGLKESGFAAGTYIDISLNLKIGNEAWIAVAQTNEPVEIVVGIPETLFAEGRLYEIARSHDGSFALLQDLDDVPGTVTIATDMFSAYSIVYQDGVPENLTEEHGFLQKSKCGLCHMCPTFLGICCFIWLALLMAIALIACVILYRIRHENSK